MLESMEKTENFKYEACDYLFKDVKLQLIFSLLYADENFEYNGSNFPSFDNFY